MKTKNVVKFEWWHKCRHNMDTWDGISKNYPLLCVWPYALILWHYVQKTESHSNMDVGCIWLTFPSAVVRRWMQHPGQLAPYWARASIWKRANGCDEKKPMMSELLGPGSSGNLWHWVYELNSLSSFFVGRRNINQARAVLLRSQNGPLGQWNASWYIPHLSWPVFQVNY